MPKPPTSRRCASNCARCNCAWPRPNSVSPPRRPPPTCVHWNPACPRWNNVRPLSPPTLTALRLDFPAAAQRARAASPTADSEQGIGARIWQRVLNLVTVRAGDTVLVGTPAAIVLGQASERLGSGDLAGAVAALDALDPAGSAAIVDWRTAATSLLAARSALAALMAPGIAE